MGKILRVNLSDQSVSTLKTADYEQWGGGHGMGSAIFWDLCKEKAISGFDPRNVVTIMTSPLSGTLAPSVSGRCEVQGIGVQGYPWEWFTRSNFGGRFSAMLKWAGWDGIVIEGKAEKPVWLDIRNDDVHLRSAAGVWGLDTVEAQKKIWQLVEGNLAGKDWWPMDSGRDSGRTTQRPAVLCIGPAGENLCRSASLVHDGGNGAGQGGFGGVWGSKNLKAISVIGTHGVKVADPAALMEARLWAKNNYGFREDDLKLTPGLYTFGGNPTGSQGGPPGTKSRPTGCVGCHRCCHGGVNEYGLGNGSHCFDGYLGTYDAMRHGGKATLASVRSMDNLQRYGINAWEMSLIYLWLPKLYKLGVLGRGKAINTDLPFDRVGELDLDEEIMRRIAYRQEIGADLAEGVARAAKKWGRYEQDTKSGILPLQEWGYAHHYDARTEVEWGYGSLFGDRDINEHDFTWPCYWVATIGTLMGGKTPVTAAEMAQIIGEKLVPYKDPLMVDYSDTGIYSDAMAKTVAWHRHYTRFYKQSVLYCDWAYADFLNVYGPNNRGLTPEAEPKFWGAVTGKNITFEQGLEIGRKIWNLDRSIWVLQGRRREQEKYADYIYEKPAQPSTYATYEVPYIMPAFENGEWKYKNLSGRVVDRQKLEGFKTKYYKLEGWDPATGWPTRGTLESLGLKGVADTLAQAGKLGKG
jgi:aldehyde:ferredoxin oxidoreductase